jgi:hypothetical protein
MLVQVSSALALPALQLGPDGSPNWVYNTVTQTWTTTDNPLGLNAYANEIGETGGYAWDPAGASTQIGYLVASAVPMSILDVFDITVMNDGGPLALYTSGVGAPPIEDPNSLAPHGIFDTWFEVYAFNFDGPLMTISDTQPGGTGMGLGFLEEFTININSNMGDAIHFDLFAVQGDGVLDLGSTDLKTVSAFAPFSHDAQTDQIPEPTSAVLFLVGALAVGKATRRASTKA